MCHCAAVSFRRRPRWGAWSCARTIGKPPPSTHLAPARGCLRNNARAWTWCFQCAALPTSLDGGPCSTTASGSLELGSSQTCAARKILAALGHRRPQRKTSPSINAPAASCSAKAAHASGAAPTWSCQLPSAYLAPALGGFASQQPRRCCSAMNLLLLLLLIAFPQAAPQWTHRPMPKEWASGGRP